MSQLICLIIGVLYGLLGAYSHVNVNELTEATGLCASNGGIEILTAKTVGDNSISCKNGARFEIKDSK
jgi:hypothetical protein